MKLHKLLIFPSLLVLSAGAYAQEKNKGAAVPTAQEGRMFLNRKKAEKGVMTTSSGLQYKVLKKGNGPVPDADDKVNLNYVLTMINGDIVSDDFKTKIWEHHIDKALLGMQEAIKMMPEGSEWLLFIPAELAFGDQDFANAPQGSTIVCNLKLVKVVQ